MDNQFIPHWPSGGVVKKPWVGLTDEEWQEIADKTDIIIWNELKEAIESKLKDKNT